MVRFSIGSFDTDPFFLMEVDELELIINGEKIRIPADESTVTALLKHFNLHQKVVIVELNDEILTKENLSETLLSNGDKVEIVHFVGGG
jgi:sulfur carrier protein